MKITNKELKKVISEELQKEIFGLGSGDKNTTVDKDIQLAMKSIQSAIEKIGTGTYRGDATKGTTVYPRSTAVALDNIRKALESIQRLKFEWAKERLSRAIDSMPQEKPGRDRT